MAIFLVAFAVMFIAGLTVVIPPFEEAQAVISIGDQAADVDDDISLTELAVDVVEQALAEIGLVEDAPQQEEDDDDTDSVSVSSQHDTNVEEQHSTQQRTQEQVDRNENIQVDVQNQEERIVTDDSDGTDG
ncbi:MAG: hypothetical protein M3382_00540 [Thermoproteota archaeon]|nr:hypothetical protein [Thermoproteota archaeon]